METKVRKWGNSIALRIPKAFADQLQIAPDSDVEILLRDGTLVLKPLQAPRYTLEELLQEITPEMLHGEIDTGPSVGAEEW